MSFEPGTSRSRVLRSAAACGVLYTAIHRIKVTAILLQITRVWKGGYRFMGPIRNPRIDTFKPKFKTKMGIRRQEWRNLWGTLTMMAWRTWATCTMVNPQLSLSGTYRVMSITINAPGNPWMIYQAPIISLLVTNNYQLYPIVHPKTCCSVPHHQKEKENGYIHYGAYLLTP